ncbi:MAG: esterase FrsA [Conexibacteraceae bacterium]|nr:esterase FrsA [Conexibacteraceae bacterium]
MPDTQLDTAIRNWQARMVANGVDVNDYQRVAGSVDTWEDWLPAWEGLGDRLASEAADAERAGRKETAGELWRRAASAYHFGKFVWVVDIELHGRAGRKAADALSNALRLLDPSAQRLEIPFDGASMVAIYRRPAGGAPGSLLPPPRQRAQRRPLPLVVIIPGLDSTKEEFYETEAVLHQRGMATLTLEGPGQGETGLALPLRHDYEVPVGVALDFIRDVDTVDHERIGLLGVSLGGYYAPRVAAFEPRVRAVAAVSGPFNFGACWDDLPQMTRETFQHTSLARDPDDARRRASELDLAGVAVRIEQPLLVMTGDRDRIIPWEQTKRIADEAQNATWKLYAGGTHVVNNMPYLYRNLAADWLRERLTA